MVILNERETLSKYRKIFLNETNKSVEDWCEYAYVPLDIPRFNCPEIVDWFYSICKPVERTKVTSSNPDIYELNFNSAEVYYDGNVSKKKTTRFRSVNDRPDFIEKFPDFYQQIISTFPFKSFKYLMFLNSTGQVPYHRDHENFLDGPTQFRIMLYDENPEETLGFVNAKPDEKIDANNIHLHQRISDTNSMAWNNIRLKHGSSYTPGYKKLILGLLDYELDIDRFNDLMNRSIEKYKDYVMIVSGPTSNYVNT